MLPLLKGKNVTLHVWTVFPECINENPPWLVQPFWNKSFIFVLLIFTAHK